MKEFFFRGREFLVSGSPIRPFLSAFCSLDRTMKLPAKLGSGLLSPRSAPSARSFTPPPHNTRFQGLSGPWQACVIEKLRSGLESGGPGLPVLSVWRRTHKGTQSANAPVLIRPWHTQRPDGDSWACFTTRARRRDDGKAHMASTAPGLPGFCGVQAGSVNVDHECGFVGRCVERETRPRPSSIHQARCSIALSHFLSGRGEYSN
jgi:hypothetical protein